MISPFSYNYFPYREDDFPFQIAFLNLSGDSLDAGTIYDTIRFRIFTAGQEDWPVFDWTLGDGLSIEEINDESVIVGSLTDEQTIEMLNTTYYYEFVVIKDGSRRTFTNGQINIYDVHSVTHRKGSILYLTIDDLNPMILIGATVGEPSDPIPPPPPDNEFIHVQGGLFMLGNDPFTFNGTNAYYLPNYQKAGDYPGDPAMVDRAFDAFEEGGVKVIRMWAFYDGYDVPGSYSSQDARENVIQTDPGVYSEEALADLDLIISKGKERGMKFILPFVNYWQELGGISQYNFWAGNGTASWGNNRMQMFMDGTQQQQWFRQYISMLLNRVNTETGVAYKDETAIMAWEIINEGRNPADAGSGVVLRDWYREIAQFIKSIDSNHLLATGEEGLDENEPLQYTAENYSNTYCNRAQEGTSYILNTQIPEIDFGRAHWYPDAFGMGISVNPALLLSQEAYCLDRYNIALTSGKPFMLGEFGLPSWNEDSKLAMYVPHWEMVENSGIAGSLIWQLTADHHKSFEFGGNINWPGGNRHLKLFLEFLNHSLNQNGTPATDPPEITSGAVNIESFTNNDIIVRVAPAQDEQFPQGIIYELYVSLSDNIQTVEDMRDNGMLMQQLYSEGTDGYVELEANNLEQDTLYYVNVLARTPAEHAAAYSGNSQQTEFGDQIPPILPGDTTVTEIDELTTVFVLGYNQATDETTPQEFLRYEVWVSDSGDPGTNYVDIQANGELKGTSTGTDEVAATNVLPNRNYFCRIVVLDEQDNPAVYNLVQVQTSLLREYSIDESNPISDDLVAYIPFNEGIGNTVADIAEGVSALIEGDGGAWDFLEGRKIWRKRNDHSEWVTLLYRDNLSFSGGALTIHTVVEISHVAEGLYYIAYKGGNPGFHIGFPGWTNAIRIQIGNLSIDVSSPIVEQIKNAPGLHQIGLTIDSPSGTATVYIDGAVIGTEDLSGQASDLEINWDITMPIIDASTGYAVAYDTAAFWTRELSPQEMADLWNTPDLLVVEGSEIDTDPPIISDPTITEIGVTATTATFSFVKATDAVDPQTDLVYSLYTSELDNMNTVEDTLENGTLRAVQTDVDQLTGAGMDPETPYFAQILVTDTSDNMSVYNSIAFETDPPEPPPVDPEIDTGHPMAADLIAYYQFHELEGTVIHDISNSPNVHDGSTNGGSWNFVGGVPCWIRETGQNHSIVIPDHPDLRIPVGQPFTVCLKLAYDTNNSFRNGLIAKASNPGWSIEMPGWEPQTLEVYLGSLSKQDFNANIEGDGILHTVFLTIDDIDGGTARLYIDGVLNDTFTLTGQANDGVNPNDLILPDLVSDTNREYIYNKIGIWRRELSAQEVNDWHLDPDLMLLEA